MQRCAATAGASGDDFKRSVGVQGTDQAQLGGSDGRGQNGDAEDDALAGEVYAYDADHLPVSDHTDLGASAISDDGGWLEFHRRRSIGGDRHKDKSKDKGSNSGKRNGNIQGCGKRGLPMDKGKGKGKYAPVKDTGKSNERNGKGTAASRLGKGKSKSKFVDKYVDKGRDKGKCGLVPAKGKCGGKDSAGTPDSRQDEGKSKTKDNDKGVATGKGDCGTDAGTLATLDKLQTMWQESASLCSDCYHGLRTLDETTRIIQDIIDTGIMEGSLPPKHALMAWGALFLRSTSSGSSSASPAQ